MVQWTKQDEQKLIELYEQKRVWLEGALAPLRSACMLYKLPAEVAHLLKENPLPMYEALEPFILKDKSMPTIGNARVRD